MAVAQNDADKKSVDFNGRISMYAGMRTTLILDDQLVEAAKREAADRHTTLSSVVNHALRDALLNSAKPATAVRPFKMITFGGGKVRDTSPAEIAELRDN